jgi:hypothetical protein
MKNAKTRKKLRLFKEQRENQYVYTKKSEHGKK